MRGDGTGIRGHSGHQRPDRLCARLRRGRIRRGVVRLPRVRRVGRVAAPTRVGLTPAPGLPRCDRRCPAASWRRPGTHCAVGYFVLRRSRCARRRRGGARRGGDRVDAGDRWSNSAGPPGAHRRHTSSAACGRTRYARCAAGDDTAQAASSTDGRRAGLARDLRDGRRGAGLWRGRRAELAQRGVRAHGARGGVQPADQVRAACRLPAFGSGRHRRPRRPAGHRPSSGRQSRCSRGAA